MAQHPGSTRDTVSIRGSQALLTGPVALPTLPSHAGITVKHVGAVGHTLAVQEAVCGGTSEAGGPIHSAGVAITLTFTTGTIGTYICSIWTAFILTCAL